MASVGAMMKGMRRLGPRFPSLILLACVLGACSPDASKVADTSADPAVEATATPTAPAGSACALLVDERIHALNVLIADVGAEYDRWINRRQSRREAKDFLDAVRPGQELNRDLFGDLPPRIENAMEQEQEINYRFARQARRADCTPREVADLENERVLDIKGTSFLADLHRFQLAQPYRDVSGD